MTVGGTSNAAAQKLYLKAKAQLHSDDRENSLRTAIGLLDAAIALDPKFADGYALKAHAMSDLNGFYTAAGAGFAPGFVQAASVAQQAISIAPDLAAGHLTLAEIRKWQLDVGAAAVEYQKGHSLAGGDVDDLLAYTGFLWMMGRTDEAIDAAREAEARDPLNPATYSAEGSAQSSAERFAQAESAYRKALNLAPNLSLPRGRLGATLVEMGKFDEAEAEFRKLPPDNLFRLIGEAILFWRQGNRAASDAALLHAERSNGDDAHYQYAEVHAQRGEKDEAFASLDRAWSFHDPGLAIMKADRYLIPLRGDPRFAALLKKMNFPS